MNQNKQDQDTNITSTPYGYRGIGIRRKRNDKTLDVTFTLLWPLQFPVTGNKNGFEEIEKDQLLELLTDIKSTPKNYGMEEKHLNHLNVFIQSLSTSSIQNHFYTSLDFIDFRLSDLKSPPDGLEDIYFRLHLISTRHQLPHQINLEGIFGILPNMVWTNQGPILPDDFPQQRDLGLWGINPLLSVTHVDKFPYLVNYVIPEGVRLGDASRVRLGAYLGPGTTVMPAGYVNFNAGTRGPAMVEGRVSAGVVVGENSDVGGGASIMGTLSGGNQHVIEIGAKCLIGANAGTGISLGFGCTIAAGTYVTAASKVYLYNQERKPVNLNNELVKEGENLCKGLDLSGRSKILFYHDTATGHLVCRPNSKTIDLNPILHTQN